MSKGGNDKQRQSCVMLENEVEEWRRELLYSEEKEKEKEKNSRYGKHERDGGKKCNCPGEHSDLSTYIGTVGHPCRSGGEIF